MTSQSLVDRAARAVRRADIAHDLPLPEEEPLWRHRHRGRLARITVGLLGIDPADIVVADDPDRDYGGNQGFVVTVHAGRSIYRFVPDVGDEDTLYLLWLCAGCGRMVAHAAISSLADFGRCLASDGAVAVAGQACDWDPAHARDCPLRSPGTENLPPR